MWHTHENKGTSYYLHDRQVKKYHQPPGTPQMNIFKILHFKNLDKIMNARGKSRDESIVDGIFESDEKYCVVTINIAPPEKNNPAL